jgi:chromosome segregation ATPase
VQPRRQDQARDRRPPPAARNLLREAQLRVREIIDDLQQALEEMESLQRLLDQVERERREDLQELESLRRSLDALRSHRTSTRLSHPRPQPAAAVSRSVDDAGNES